MAKYGFIGCGNMGGALVRAAARSVDAGDIYISDFDSSKVDALVAECGVKGADNDFVASECNYIVLGAKPQVLLTVLLPSIAPKLKDRDDFVLVSMAAGIKIEQITQAVGINCPVIRIMPNTSAGVGEGMTVYCSNDKVTNCMEEGLLSLLRCSGKLDKLEEKLFDAATSVMSCGPAFAYLFMEALADGGVKCGLPRDKALTYAEQMLKGAAATALISGKHPGVLKDQVCSPAGSTIEGVYALEKGGFRASVMDAVVCSYLRNKELGK